MHNRLALLGGGILIIIGKHINAGQAEIAVMAHTFAASIHLIKQTGLIKHMACEGNVMGRTPIAQNLAEVLLHKEGAKVFRKICDYARDIGIKYLTFYAFSTENWKRPEKEVNAIMDLLGQYIDYLYTVMDKDNIQIHFIGDKSRFTPELRERLEKAEEDSAKYDRILNVALNYGGRDELVHSVNKLIEMGKKEITEEDITENLYTSHCPDPDLIVRTAGEIRTSNFLMWQGAYSELYFTDVLWPDFSERDVDMAVEEYYRRTRRFGAVV